MCTVTVIALDTPHGPGVRLVSNRDEIDARPPAEPPRWRGDAIWPRDTLAGGTWVAATKAGVVCSLLNNNLEPPPDLPEGLTSRGALIPSLADAPDLGAMERRLLELNPSAHAPFRLIAADPSRVLEYRWDRERPELIRHDPPACFASSGLGDSVAAPRLPLFEKIVAPEPTLAAQDAFHRHAWPADAMDQAGAASVLMRRAGARSVSICVAEARPNGRGGWWIDMAYEPLAE